MAREGKTRSKNRRNSNYKHPDPNSRRSERRKNRGFKSLETSVRKHRRAARRSAFSRTIGGSLQQPGTKMESKGAGGWIHNAGGSIKYHAT